MPIYEYQCQRCDKVTEVFLRSGEKEPKKCAECSGKLKRLISHSGFQLKGTGWYVTDYARKGKKDPAASESSAASAAKSETKPEAKTETSPESKPESKPASKPADKSK